jgi:hypothetical protein
LIVTEPHQCSFEPKQELSFFSLHSIGIKLFVQLHEIVGIHGDPIQRLRVSALCTPQQVAYGEQGAMSVQYSITQRLTAVTAQPVFKENHTAPGRIPTHVSGRHLETCIKLLQNVDIAKAVTLVPLTWQWSQSSASRASAAFAARSAVNPKSARCCRWQ